MIRRLRFPGDKRFAFTIFDDTDVATVENVRPVYDLLTRLGMRTTKTVWPVDCPEGSRNFSSSETLADPDYLDFVRHLSECGFELTWHGATMESSSRDRTLRALDIFQTELGTQPRIHANHAYNLENVYWGSARVDSPALRLLLRFLDRHRRGAYYGHIPGSRYWWGDVCAERFDYVRNLTFEEVNLLRVNPSMPYHDPRRPLVKRWFSASDAEDADAFVRLLNERALDRLEEEGGVCIVATHLGKEFAPAGRLDPAVRRTLESLGRRNGWFAPVGEILDWLQAQRASAEIPRGEWRRMQWQWAGQLLARKLRLAFR